MAGFALRTFLNAAAFWILIFGGGALIYKIPSPNGPGTINFNDQPFWDFVHWGWAFLTLLVIVSANYYWEQRSTEKPLPISLTTIPMVLSVIFGKAINDVSNWSLMTFFKDSAPGDSLSPLLISISLGLIILAIPSSMLLVGYLTATRSSLPAPKGAIVMVLILQWTLTGLLTLFWMA